MFTLSFILSKRRYDLGDIFEIGVAYWAAPPVSTNQQLVRVILISLAHLLTKIILELP